MRRFSCGNVEEWSQHAEGGTCPSAVGPHVEGSFAGTARSVTLGFTNGGRSVDHDDGRHVHHLPVDLLTGPPVPQS
jgi:hypothetical protein